MKSGFRDKFEPTRVTEVTGCGLWIFTSTSGSGPPVITVPSVVRSPMVFDMTRIPIFSCLKRKALRWMNLVPASAIPINAFMSIFRIVLTFLTRLGSADRMPFALVTSMTSSASNPSARSRAVVSLPPRPRVLTRPSLVRPMNPPMTGIMP